MKSGLRKIDWERPGSLGIFGAGIRRAREELGFTLDAVAGATGISKPYLSNIELGRAPGPASEEKLRRIAGVLGLEVGEVLAGADWLRTPASVRRAVEKAEGRRMKAEIGSEEMGGEEEVERRADGTIDLDWMMGEGKRETRNTKLETGGGDGEGGGAFETRNLKLEAEEGGGRLKPVLRAGEMGLRRVPLINRVAAGKASEFTDLNYPAGVADAYVAAPDLPEARVAAAFALRVVGDSMMPEYREGEILVVGPSESGPRDGEDCVVRLGELDGFATTFKRVFLERDAGGETVGVRLVALNAAYGERRVKVEDVTGIYPLMYRLVPAGVRKVEEERGSFTTERVSIEND